MITDRNSNVNDRRFEGIEERLKAIEAQLWRDASANQAIIEEDDQDMAESLDGDSPTIFLPNTPATLQDGTIVSAFNWGKKEELPLPPLPEIQHVMTDFFGGFNQAIPLFSHGSFLKMVDDWYNFPNRRDKASWSSINVVLALSLRHTTSGQTIIGDKVASMCISNAQSVMDSLVYRDIDHKGLQVILGLALLFMATAHPQPACVLIATAVKLVHRLKLHVQGDEDADSQTATERARLVWITYIIDRDLSLHTFEPYLLQDHDIGLDVDDIACEDGLGILLLDDEQVRVDILKLRIRLATIQGKVYDLIYSVRASKLSLNQKQAANDRLQRMLEDWYNSLPDSFKADEVSALETNFRRHCISLHITYYQCLFATRKASIRNSEWIKRLTEFSDTLEHGEHTSNAAQSATLLPSNWSTLVEAARSCLAMLDLIEPFDTALRWSSTCACEAAITILAANNLTLSEHDLHDSVDSDAEKIRISLEEFKQRIHDSGEAFLQTSTSKMEELPIKPSGIFMQHDFITPEHEEKLIHIFEHELEWPARPGRLSLHYGYTFSYKTFGIDEDTPFKPFPDWLVPLLPTTEGRPPDQVCLQQYAPGTGIPPHVDTHGPFDQLYSLSLGSPLFMQFANKETGERIEVDLLPRSMMQMSGDSRLHWTHGIKSRKTDTLSDGTVRLRKVRWSLTYRWLRGGAECECGNEKLCDTAQRRNGVEREYRWKQYEEDAKKTETA
ncbi:hypothetical protein FSARC_12506 [Fusarium sarcochroum]|uniref:Fe2OG dioxygenase domain-containing protein n=1 Tax=Fusarium sarcochroum TaxID=1208366 RepID=A0A8H4WWI3_9HYPO|nr:hypothetical protein FSARC_12506 [Fusarium sarcochroum]